MNYVVKVDQGLTGNFSGTLSGSGATFAKNTIAPTFGADKHRR